MTSNEIEHNLMRLVEASDRNAPRLLYDAYAGYLTGVCARYLSDGDDLKDVVQESFINIFGSLGNFSWSGPGSLRAWMTRIAVNQSLKYLRGNHRMVCVPIIECPDCAADDSPDVESVPQAVLLSMIRDLPPGYRTVFNLFVFEEKSHREIAEILGIKENSSASQYHRAKAILAEKIKSYINNSNSDR